MRKGYMCIIITELRSSGIGTPAGGARFVPHLGVSDAALWAGERKYETNVLACPYPLKICNPGSFGSRLRTSQQAATQLSAAWEFEISRTEKRPF